MKRIHVLFYATGLMLDAGLAAAAAAPLPTAPDLKAIASQVKESELAFAQSMRSRRLDEFVGFVAEDAVFTGETPAIGRAAVVDRWRKYFTSPEAPFSWAPDAITVAADGRTAVSTGPVRRPDGAMVSRFTSIWRKGDDGHWRVIADQGVDACDCPCAGK